jgi:hypothetical protein
MTEGTPLGSEYNKPMAGVLKGPTAELYLYLYLNKAKEELKRKPMHGQFYQDIARPSVDKEK